MSKRMIEICNENFELQRLPISNEQINREFNWAKGKSIYEAYGNPSVAKVNAFEHWQVFANEVGAFRIAVSSANTFHFSVIIETEYYFLWITAQHNRCFLKENTGLRWFIVNGNKIAEPFHTN